MSEIKEFEVKTQLSERQFKAMQAVIEAAGFTTAGYVRHLILSDVVNRQEQVSQLNEIMDRAEMAQK